MSAERVENGVAQGVASNLVMAALSTPQGQEVVVETVVLAVAAAPAVAVVAATAGVVYATNKVMQLLGL